MTQRTVHRPHPTLQALVALLYGALFLYAVCAAVRGLNTLWFVLPLLIEIIGIPISLAIGIGSYSMRRVSRAHFALFVAAAVWPLLALFGLWALPSYPVVG